MDATSVEEELGQRLVKLYGLKGLREMLQYRVWTLPLLGALGEPIEGLMELVEWLRGVENDDGS